MEPFVPQQLPIETLDWEGMIPAIGAANRAIAHYAGTLHGIPDPEVLLSPLTTGEAVLSSRIEGTQATLSEVLEFEAGAEVSEPSRREDIQEIINYRRALGVAEARLSERPLSLNLLKELHSVLLESARGRNKARGEFRRTQNWIGRPGAPMADATFVPPDPSHVMPLLDNWEKYYHQDDRDPLVQLALLHAQFEIVHPFLDGNGRLGRIVIPLFLFEKRILSRPMFYLSAYLEAHRDRYMDGLRRISAEGDWNNWVAFFLEALAKQAESNTQTVRAIMELYERLKREVVELTRSKFAVPLLDHLFANPVFNSRVLVGRPDMPSRATVMTLLRQMRDAGLIDVVHENRGQRPQAFALTELVDLCEET